MNVFYVLTVSVFSTSDNNNTSFLREVAQVFGGSSWKVKVAKCVWRFCMQFGLYEVCLEVQIVY